MIKNLVLFKKVFGESKSKSSRNVENRLLWFTGLENQVRMQVDTNGSFTQKQPNISLCDKTWKSVL